ncbi:U-box domain-containing protein 35-like isoform X2 [Syzygium oleosum]|uniref:U-box domain-containing protein 35-like isoform X2 n=1 Tax=Syzygium oleosum TaxID=219896 RepID=UPI0024BBE51E|nr:U-box domain-containing protein 35-like isoform X2 [Syzygium oleosum]
MWVGKSHVEKKAAMRNGLVAVAIDSDKGSQYAIRWAADNILSKGQTVILIHVHHNSASASSPRHHRNYDHHTNSSIEGPAPHKQELQKLNKDLFLTFHCYCTRKDIHCLDVILEDLDVARAITEYVSYAGIELLVLGASHRHGFIRLKHSNIPSSVSKGAPDFCTVYVVSKGKVSSVRNASRPSPYASPLLEQIQNLNKQTAGSEKHLQNSLKDQTSIKSALAMPNESIRSALDKGRGSSAYAAGMMPEVDTDISFISSGRSSTDQSSSMLYDRMDSIYPARLSTSPDRSSIHSLQRFIDFGSSYELSPISQESGRTSCSFSSQNLDDAEVEMRRLKLELKQTMEMYSTACKEALVAKQKAMELQRWRYEEERRLDEAQHAKENALSIAEKERVKYKAALEQAESAQRIAELEAQRRLNAEMKALREAEEIKKVLDELQHSDARYRRYTIEEIEAATNFFAESHKVGEGGYGPVFKCYLDHTPVAVKVLRPDAAQGRSQFQQEVEVLSRIRHPNMVLLLGACPEYGCLVYEYMANGSLEERLFQRRKSPVLSWQIRFKIAAEIATGLLFLHQTKPEPLVHRDLKPGNILLDYNYISKISDVGLARLVPPSVAETVTQYRMTSTAGTFCYIDPEYQQTGMLGVKSDVYSFGIVLLQLITAKSPMGITHHISKSIEKGNFSEMLDPEVPDWPVEEALSLAQIALQCAEMRRKDRPDLGKVVLPELNKLRDFAEENLQHCSILGGSALPSPHHSHISTAQVSQSLFTNIWNLEYKPLFSLHSNHPVNLTKKQLISYSYKYQNYVIVNRDGVISFCWMFVVQEVMSDPLVVQSGSSRSYSSTSAKTTT